MAQKADQKLEEMIWWAARIYKSKFVEMGGKDLSTNTHIFVQKVAHSLISYVNIYMYVCMYKF